MKDNLIKNKYYVSVYESLDGKVYALSPEMKSCHLVWTPSGVTDGCRILIWPVELMPEIITTLNLKKIR